MDLLSIFIDVSLTILIQGDDKSKVNCRWDYHQTASHVIVTIYAKQYDVEKSVVKLNPIRLNASLAFPTDNTSFSLDVELKGVILLHNLSRSST